MIAIVLAALMQAASSAEPASVWTSLPTAEDLASFYPKDALADGVGGRAVLICAVDAQGFLADCRVDNEYPTGRGFGDAALALQRKFRMRPAGNGTSSRKTSVRIPIRFEPPPREPPLDPAVKLAKPDWLGRPTAEQFAKFYPEKALRQSIGGMAVAQCAIAATGKLEDCKLVYEDPPGLGFGEATLKIMPYFEARTVSAGGVSLVGQTVQIPIRFGMEGSL